MRRWKVKRIVASNDDGWGTTWIKQTIEIPLDTVYEILDTLGVAFKRKII